MNDYPTEYILPVDDWIQAMVNWLVAEWRPAFQVMRWPIAEFLDLVNDGLAAIPYWLFILLLLVGAWRLSGWKNAMLAAGSFLFIAMMGLWDQSMKTLAIVLTAVVFGVITGVPLGVLAARSDKVWAVMRPVLDLMQTTPSFVYLVPVVMLFGIGTVPGVIATIIFSLPPMIRLTNLGIRQVPLEATEAGEAFGTTEWQSLVHIRFPLALPSIMAGLNQTLLLAMVMSVIASMIGAEGLGLTVLRGIGRLDVGLAAIGGGAIVLMAITLDRLTQAFAEKTR